MHRRIHTNLITTRQQIFTPPDWSNTRFTSIDVLPQEYWHTHVHRNVLKPDSACGVGGIWNVQRFIPRCRLAKNALQFILISVVRTKTCPDFFAKLWRHSHRLLERFNVWISPKCLFKCLLMLFERNSPRGEVIWPRLDRLKTICLATRLHTTWNLSQLIAYQTSLKPFLRLT